MTMEIDNLIVATRTVCWCQDVVGLWQLLRFVMSAVCMANYYDDNAAVEAGDDPRRATWSSSGGRHPRGPRGADGVREPEPNLVAGAPAHDAGGDGVANYQQKPYHMMKSLN